MKQKLKNTAVSHYLKLIILIFILPTSIFAQERADDFSIRSVDGTSLQLSDFEGKVVYISFWASWCGVCKSNFRKYADTREAVEKEGVILLNVSMDKDETAWKNAIAKYNIAGDHYIVNDYEKVKRLYQLYGLPSYEILNKNQQKVALSDRPGRDIVEEFKKWLAE